MALALLLAFALAGAAGERAHAQPAGDVAPLVFDSAAEEAARRRLDRLTKPPGSLGRLEELVVRLCEIQGRCPPSLRDPVIFTVAGGAIAILLAFVIPTFQSMFESAGIPLPLPTRVVIAMSQILQSYWWLIGAGIIGAVFLVRAYYKTPAGNLMIDRMLLNIPILGDLQRKAAVSRLSRSGRCRTASIDSPAAETSMRSIAFSSSRTLPGQA